MPELIAVRVYLSALVGHIREIGDDERGDLPLEPVMLVTTVAVLAVSVIVLGILKLIRLLAGS